MQRYESYKPSGIQWVEKIPSHWGAERAKWLFDRMERPVRPEDDVVTAFRDGQVTLRTNRRTEGFTNAIQEHGYQGIRKGDLVIHAMDAFAGAIGVSDSDGKSTPVYAACVPRGEYPVNSYYYAYLLRYMAHSGYIESLSKGIRERSTDFRFAEFRELPLPIPDKDEQDRIVAFLDQKTAEINAAITKKEQLIALLNEEKAIAISLCLTGRIQEKSELVSSGNEWIGKIPACWKVKKLKHLISLLTDFTANGAFADLKSNVKYLDQPSYSRLVRLTDLRSNLSENGVWVSEKSHKYLSKSELFGGDVLMANVGAYAGHSFQMPKDYMGKATLAPNMFLIRFDKRKIHNDFAYWMLQADYAVRRLESIALSAAQPKLNKFDVKNIEVAYPQDVNDQICVARRCGDISESFSNAKELHKQSIKNLQALKQSLVEAAVSGKIRI